MSKHMVPGGGSAASDVFMKFLWDRFSCRQHMHVESAKQFMNAKSHNAQCLAKAKQSKVAWCKKASSMGAAGGWSEVFMMTALRLSVSPRASSSRPGSGWGSNRPGCGSAAGSPELQPACSENTHTHTYRNPTMNIYPNIIKTYIRRPVIHHASQTSPTSGEALICHQQKYTDIYREAQKDTKFILDYGEWKIPVYFWLEKACVGINPCKQKQYVISHGHGYY